MAVKGVKVSVKELQVGMYVSDLDRPWCQTPFPIQGFFIQDEHDIKRIAAFCKTVMVDQSLDRSGFRYTDNGIEAPESKRRAHKEEAQTTSGPKVVKCAPIKIKNPQAYETSSTLKKEVEVAKRLHDRMAQALSDVFRQLDQGLPASLDETEAVAEGMVDSVVRNPDAMVWLGRFRQKDGQGFVHCINASVWGLVFGRHLGLSKDLLKNLATGILFSHIGKARLSRALLQNGGGMDAAQFDEYKKYVNYGVEILKESGSVSQQVISVVKHHKERHNGTGYPEAITGDRIPLLGKIAGLVDTYQEMISPCQGGAPLTPAQAISRLYELRNIEYQEDLVEHFIMAVGVYPTGSVVELSSREIGIVVTNNTTRRLEPKVMIVRSADQKEMKAGKVIDLSDLNEKRNRPIQISNSLSYDSIDMDLSKYQVTGATQRWSMQHLMG